MTRTIGIAITGSLRISQQGFGSFAKSLIEPKASVTMQAMMRTSRYNYVWTGLGWLSCKGKGKSERKDWLVKTYIYLQRICYSPRSKLIIIVQGLDDLTSTTTAGFEPPNRFPKARNFESNYQEVTQQTY